MEHNKALDIVFVCIPLVLLIIAWGTKKKSWPTWIVFVINAIPIAITLVLTLCSIPETGLTIAKITELNPVLWGAYTFAIGAIEWLIDKYKKLMPQTKESYEFNNRYSDIQNQWDLMKTSPDYEKKRMFIDESLRMIEDALAHGNLYHNRLSDIDLAKFASSVGTLSKDYVHLCSNQKAFYNEIFASLHRYLFSEYKTKVLSSIQANSNDGADLIIPEFVSNGLTKTVIEHSNIVEYQYNTSVTSIKDFENNVGEELKGNPNNNFLRRIIITDEVDSPDNIDIKVFNKIITWHNMSKMDLRFISLSKAKELMQNYTSISCLDFSIIKMKNKKEFTILWADKIAPRPIAGQNQEMYSVKCMFATSQPDADRLFVELWKEAKIGEVDNKNTVVFK